MMIALCHSSDLEHTSSGELHCKTNRVAITIRLNNLTCFCELHFITIRLNNFFVNFRPYGTKPFDVTEDGEVEQLSVVKVTTQLYIPFRLPILHSSIPIPIPG